MGGNVIAKFISRYVYLLSLFKLKIILLSFRYRFIKNYLILKILI